MITEFSCLFSFKLPVQGRLDCRRGNLSLDQDLILSHPSYWSPFSCDAAGHHLNFHRDPCSTPPASSTQLLIELNHLRYYYDHLSTLKPLPVSLER